MKPLSAAICLFAAVVTPVSAQTVSTISTGTTGTKNALWRVPSVVHDISGGTYEITVNLSPRVDTITIEYGYDASPLYLSNRRLSSSSADNKSAANADPNQQQQQQQVQSNMRENTAHATPRRRRRRRLQEDPFFVFGGTLRGEYIHGSSHYKATWDERFHVLVEPAANKKSEIYVFEEDDGSKSFPCIYFPNGNMTPAKVVALGSLEDAIAAGGEEGHVLFDIASNDAFTLYYANDTVISSSAGGQFVSDISVSGSIPGSNVTLSNIYGGINGKVFDWTPTSKFRVTTVSAEDMLVKRGVATITIDVYAENEKLNDFAFALFDVDAEGNVELADEGFQGGNQRNQGPSSAGALFVGTSFLLLATITSLLSW